MKDPAFITQMLQKGNEATAKVKLEFSTLTLQQLNWKPAPDSWSIGECLDHLMVSGTCYFPAFKKITEGKYTMTAWEKWSPLTAILGRMLVDRLQEEVKVKMKAPKVFLPSASNKEIGIAERFLKFQEAFLGYVAACDQVDLDRTIITSPSVAFVTYSLRDAIRLLIPHEHRHINQAVRLKTRQDFPK